MKRNMIRLITLLGVFPVSGVVMAHPGHKHLAGVNPHTHHFADVGNLAGIAILVLVVAVCWAFARRH